MARAERLITIVFFGDSITEGQYVTPPLRWVDIVSGGLQLRYRDDPFNLLVLVRGVSGETTRQALERFPRDLQAHTPDIVTLQYGLNDCNCWLTDHGLPRVSEAAFRANLVEMIERARRFGAREIILSNNHPTLRHKPLLDGLTLEQRRRRYNEIVADVAAETGVTSCDIEAGFAGLDDAALAGQLIPYPDLLHLSEAGHRRYASLIGPYVERAVEEIMAARELR
ncbi:MAG TPA: SGNH/GDSL hydrolase family protein [Stellaceae bacterium]|nr:SGNH/GDSL hydrolase family protein [Stellaceae bacterium]